MIRFCFTLEQQKRVTWSKYLLTKGYGILTEEDLDDIINAVSSKGIYEITLGLSDKERSEQVANQAYDTNAITFGKAKETAMEDYNFLAKASITTIHSTNKMDGKLVATAKTLAQSIFSIETGTSKVTDRDNKENDSYNEVGKANKQVVHGKIAIEGMEIIRKGTEGIEEKMETFDKERDSALRKRCPTRYPWP